MSKPTSSKPKTRRRPGVPEASSDEARRRMESTGQRDTAAELVVRSILHGMGLRYRIDAHPVPGMRRRTDILFPQERVAVFVDGCFWHGCPTHGTWPRANAKFWREKIETNKRRDRDTNLRLRKAGWLVVRIWEHEVPSAAAARIAKIVRAKRRQAT